MRLVGIEPQALAHRANGCIRAVSCASVRAGNTGVAARRQGHVLGTVPGVLTRTHVCRAGLRGLFGAAVPALRSGGRALPTLQVLGSEDGKHNCPECRLKMILFDDCLDGVRLVSHEGGIPLAFGNRSLANPVGPLCVVRMISRARHQVSVRHLIVPYESARFNFLTEDRENGLREPLPALALAR